MSLPKDPLDQIETHADGIVAPCWCGEKKAFFSNDPYGDTCGGTGSLYCHCGGDQCVCHHHGNEIECDGCVDCQGDDEEHETYGDDDELDDPESEAPQ